MGAGIFTLWLAFSPRVRVAVMLLALLFLFKKPLLFFVREIISLLVKVVSWVFSIVFVLFEYILGLLFKIFGKKIEAKWAPRYEVFVKNLLSGLNQFEKKWKKGFTNKKLVQKRYKAVAIMIPILFMIAAFQWPNFPVVKSMTDMEAVFLHDNLKNSQTQSRRSPCGSSIMDRRLGR